MQPREGTKASDTSPPAKDRKVPLGPGCEMEKGGRGRKGELGKKRERKK